MNDNKELNVQDIEKKRKEIKSKRCAFDQDKTTVTNLVKAMDNKDDAAFIKKKTTMHIEFKILCDDTADTKISRISILYVMHY